MESNKYSEEFKQSVVSLYNAGKSSTEICKEYGMSSSTIHKWIKKYTEIMVADTEVVTMVEVKKLSKYHDIKLLCKMLKVARSTYYANINRKFSKRKIDNRTIKKAILEVYLKSGNRYGSPKITKRLRDSGYPKLSINRVNRLMKELNIKSVVVKKVQEL